MIFHILSLNEQIEQEYKLTTIGGSFSILSSKAGHNSNDYLASLEYENLTKSKESWITPINMNQNSGNQEDTGGRPTKADGDLSDSGMTTRDKENNKR